MAQNINLGEGLQFYEPSVPEGTKSGDPLVLGDVIPVIAITDRDTNGGATVVANDRIIAKVAVHAVDANDAGVAVARWDKLYKDGNKINKDSTNGVLFGYAMGTVAAGETAIIDVMLA